MQTFKQYTTVVVPNESVKSFLVDYAVSKGVPVYEPTAKKNERFDDWPNLCLSSSGHICSSRATPEAVHDREFITLDQFIKYCDNWSTSKPVSLGLTSEYNAKIYKNEQIVRVGCQRIPFDKIKEVYNVCFGTSIDQPVIPA